MNQLTEDIEVMKNLLIGSKVKSFKLDFLIEDNFKGFKGEAIFEKDSVNFTMEITMNKTDSCSVLSVGKYGVDIFSFGREKSLAKNFNKQNVFIENGFFIHAREQEHLQEALKSDFQKELARLYKYTDLFVEKDTIKYPQADWNITYFNDEGEEIKHTVTKKEQGTVRWEETNNYHEILKAYKFDDQQKLMIKNAFEQGLPYKTVSSFAKPEYNNEQMMVILFGLMKGLNLKDISIFNDPKKFTASQMEQICLGITRTVYPEEKNYHALTLKNVELYADPKFNFCQMREIRLGFENGIEEEKIKLYARPEFDDAQMQSIRWACKKGLSMEQLKLIAKTSYDAELISKLAVDTVIHNRKDKFKNSSEKFVSVVSHDGDKCNLIDVADLPEEAQFELWSVLEKYKNDIFKVKGTLDDYIDELKEFGIFPKDKDKKNERDEDKR